MGPMDKTTVRPNTDPNFVFNWNQEIRNSPSVLLLLNDNQILTGYLYPDILLYCTLLISAWPGRLYLTFCPSTFCYAHPLIGQSSHNKLGFITMGRDVLGSGIPGDLSLSLLHVLYIVTMYYSQITQFTKPFLYVSDRILQLIGISHHILDPFTVSHTLIGYLEPSYKRRQTIHQREVGLIHFHITL